MRRLFRKEPKWVGMPRLSTCQKYQIENISLLRAFSMRPLGVLYMRDLITTKE
jgi:hypothetical protein